MFKFLTILFLCALTTVAFSSPQLPDTLFGYESGTTLPNHTYVVKDSVSINVGDTLTISPGDTLLMMNDPISGAAGWIHILGTFICNGTASNRNVITTVYKDSTKPGMWGGIVGDSCKYVSVTFTNVSWAGGSDATGHAYRTFDIYSDYANTTTTVFTDNHVTGVVDDCIGLHGGNASVLRNILKWCGAPDGDNINIKAGTVGEVAYNIIWAPGGNGVKINASTSLPRLTNMCVHNNTIVAGGWRRITELGYAILVDASARAQIYNNIMGDMYSELEITTAADTLRTVYNNNLFFYSVDSLKGLANYYPSDGVGKPAPNDILNVQADSLFVSYQPDFYNDWIALDGKNDYHLLPKAAAVGRGITPPAPTSTNFWGNPFFGNGTQTLPGDVNIGALGVSTPTAVSKQNSGIPASYTLNQNYPNPFNPSTIISYSIPKSQNVVLKVYNMLGQLVTTLVNKQQNAGSYQVSFNAVKLSSGIYFYSLNTGDFSSVKKMIYLK
jgi:hypothetical protein